jgi:hypothetical protein
MTSDRVLECADTSALWDDATCRVGEKRRHVAALQNSAELLKLDEETENLLWEIAKA